MRRGEVELAVGLGLLLGPLGYALTLTPETVEVVRVVEVPRAVVVAPSTESCEAELELAPIACEPTDASEAPAVPPPEPSGPELDPRDRLGFAFVGEAGLVLTTEARRVWSTGPLFAHPGPAQFRAARRADVAKLPEEHARQVGRTFDVYGPSGKVCTARIGELTVLAQHDGPSLFEVYRGSMDEVETGSGDEDPIAAFERQRHSASQIRSKVWASLGKDGNRPWLVASLVGDTSCEGGLWARDSELPPPNVLEKATKTGVTPRRVAAFEASDELAETRTRYEQWRDELEEEERRQTAEWDDHAREYPPVVTEWADAGGTTRMTELTFGVEGEGCGDSSATAMSQIDRVMGNDFESTSWGAGASAIFDVDLDGRFEVLYDTWLASETPALQLSAAPYEVFYCPC